jgi:hypothetical protein
MRTLIRVATASAALAGFVPAAGFAQTTPVAMAANTASSEKPAAEPAAQPGQKPARQPADLAARPAPGPRWFDVQSGVLDARYRFVDSSASVTTSNHLQHRQTLKAGVKFDAKGRYSVQTTIGTGTSFIGSWEHSGLGTGDRDWNPGVRHLYVAGKPAKGIEFQIGGLGMAKTENTEITGFDNDGYMIGERLSVKRPKELYVDEVTFTVGYFGDLTTPNVFKRFDSMNDHNFTQVVVAKKLGARVTASADWAKIAGVQTWHEAARVAVKEAKAFDAVRLELYQRIDGVEGNGYAAGFEKALPHKSSLALGWANIDRANGLVNGDRYGRGQRLFVDAKMPLPADLSLNVFYTRAIDNDFALPIRTRFDVVVSYNVLKALQRTVR